MAGGKLISVTHINVRQSISFLIIKLIIIEVLYALIIVLSYVSLSQSMNFFNLQQIPTYFFISIFLVLGLLKCYLSFLVIFQWLNDYYEISPAKVIHRSGFFFRHEDHYSFEHVSAIGLQQNLIGRILNYGTIDLYDRHDREHKYLYLIHNPLRYFHVMQSLLPNLDEIQHKIRGRLFENQEEEKL